MTGPGPRQVELLAREAAYLAPGASEEAALGGRVFVSGRGAVLVDLDGNEYLDFAAGTLTQSVGHCHPEVVAALTEQAGRLWNVHDFATADRAALCELLAELLPEHLTTLAFFSTGAEVVEAALRTVQAVAEPGRNRVGALRYGFHGKTQGARMLVHWDVGHQSFAGNSVLGYSPYCYRCPLELTYPSCDVRCASLVRRHIAEKSNVSALFFEPVLGAAGVIVPPPGYWEQIAAACRDNGVLLVADEVLTGGGRTGSFLASEALGVRADLVALSKGMASGFPFAVLAGTDAVLRSPAAARAGSTASTYASNPLGIAAAKATLSVLRRDTLVDRVRVLGDLMAPRLAELHERYPNLGDVRGIGLLYGLEFVHDRQSRRPAPELARRVYQAALDLGLRTAIGGHVIRLAPPFTLDDGQLRHGLDLLDRAIGGAVGELR
ncbi:aspartate aminotransferase family protein [Polymorphospora rubra]|uniref:Acetylornithine aminotransferase n=1 Tax=Polymorphospora rubra TaxID=338584 RepID=A0A810N0D3_9ACTN|nr:aminotransferase class III-fold pyridoxal phosphate-dependent enzyme [Polymorphospora rubra]BCJ66310.1 acetylornithine aminotransferase [Polymorphospora rubra]